MATTASQRLQLPVALAVVVHAALLALPGRTVHPSMGGGDASPLFPPLSVRLAPPASETAEALLEARPATSDPRDVAVPVPRASVPQPEPVVASPAQPTWSPVAQDAPARPQDSGPAEYLTRDQLTVTPRPQTDLLVPFPDQVGGLVDLKVVVGLFIDDQGRVRRVRLDSGGVPPAFLHAIETTFLAARFSPGERDRQPVPAFIRVEVEFGARGPR